MATASGLRKFSIRFFDAGVLTLGPIHSDQKKTTCVRDLIKRRVQAYISGIITMLGASVVQLLVT